MRNFTLTYSLIMIVAQTLVQMGEKVIIVMFVGSLAFSKYIESKILN